MSIYIDFHVLQTVPPSCVNRDDTGSPKTAVYGGSVRARVSSQSWKRAMRLEFKNLFNQVELGVRTKDVVEMVKTEMRKTACGLDDGKINTRANNAIKLAGIDLKSEKDGTEQSKALFFMSSKQAQNIAAIALEYDALEKEIKKSKEDSKKVKKQTPDELKEVEAKLKNALTDDVSVDIALFGRMAANAPKLNCDAAAQVAHAISTHAVQNEYDYFTAVDDLQKDEDSGAAYLDTTEFNSSTLYRYATVNASELLNTLGKESVAEVIKKFGKAFICSMPTGKENTFANRTFPDTVYVTIRKDQPVNLCGAFEKPVKRSEEGYALASEKRLKEYADKVYANFAAEPEKAFCIGESFEKAEKLPLNDLLDKLEKEVNIAIGE